MHCGNVDRMWWWTRTIFVVRHKSQKVDVYILLWLSSLFLQANDDGNWRWYTILLLCLFYNRRAISKSIDKYNNLLMKEKKRNCIYMYLLVMMMSFFYSFVSLHVYYDDYYRTSITDSYKLYSATRLLHCLFTCWQMFTMKLSTFSDNIISATNISRHSNNLLNY
jgi:hypothetical protein